MVDQMIFRPYLIK
jgi:hypothetical protein